MTDTAHSHDDLPEGMALSEVVDALDGAFASAFVRAAKPAG